jgi:MYXO-CTERM domain-containing protein
MKKLLGLVAAVGLSCLAPAMASASTIDFDFATKGTLDKEACGFLCYDISVTGTAYDFADELSDVSQWAFTGSMQFVGNNKGTGFTDPTNPTSWSFVDDSGNNLSGTFYWVLLEGTGNAYYDITGGSGLFAGATGTGSSVISITKWYSGLPEFLEVGTMNVHTSPTTVVEPSTTGLAAVGLALVGFAAFRRRRVDVTRS